MLCCLQIGETALYWAANKGYPNIVQILIDNGAAVDRRDEMIDYLLTCGWSFGCGFIISASADIINIIIVLHTLPVLPVCQDTGTI